jgi:hypothetical protein
LAAKPLRNAENAERPLQIRLQLSLAEGCQLQHWLAQFLQTASVSDDFHPELRPVLVRLNEAAEQAVQLIQCPVCREWFAKGVRGRNAHYCGSACRQKAYRQRINALRRQIPPSRRRY